jgi:hypothetical protein
MRTGSQSHCKRVWFCTLTELLQLFSTLCKQTRITNTFTIIRSTLVSRVFFFVNQKSNCSVFIIRFAFRKLFAQLISPSKNQRKSPRQEVTNPIRERCTHKMSKPHKPVCVCRRRSLSDLQIGLIQKTKKKKKKRIARIIKEAPQDDCASAKKIKGELARTTMTETKH